MSKEDQQNISDGWRLWLADQVMSIRGALGKLEAQAVSNWQAIGQVHHRMDRMEDRISRNGSHRPSRWKYVPWGFLFKISLLLAATALIATGHLTVGEIKSYLVKRLLD